MTAQQNPDLACIKLGNLATPELDKVIKVREKSLAIEEFITFLRRNDIILCRRWDDNSVLAGVLRPIEAPLEVFLTEFFAIDPTKAEAERLSIMDLIRKQLSLTKSKP